MPTKTIKSNDRDGVKPVSVVSELKTFEQQIETLKHYENIKYPVHLNIKQIILLIKLLEFLDKINFKLSEDTLVCDNLKIKVENRLHLESKEHVVILSGRDYNKEQGFVNAVHINPALDEQGNPVKQHTPFKDWRRRPKVKRIKKHVIHRC